MQRTTKLWLGLGVIATAAAAATVTAPRYAAISTTHAAEGGEGGENGTAAASEKGAAIGFEGDLAHALDKIFAGEGGEGGAGLTTMWPRVSAPALTGDQIRTTISGNTVRSDEHHALYFDQGGSMQGWYATWAKAADASACPKTEIAGDNYFLAGDKCFQKTVTTVQGPWQVRNHQVCASITWMGERNDPCWYVAILLDRIALFDASGKIEGKGNDLKRGKVLAQVAK